MRKYPIKAYPKKVRVGLHNYDIELMQPDDERISDTLGYCWPDRRVIRIAPTQREAHDAVDTLLHEILHAAFHSYKIETEDEERIVERLATALTTVFRDNPDLLKWVGRTLRD